MSFMLLVADIVRNRRIWPEKNNTKEFATIGTITTQRTSLKRQYAYTFLLQISSNVIHPFTMGRQSSFVKQHVGERCPFLLHIHIPRHFAHQYANRESSIIRELSNGDRL